MTDTFTDKLLEDLDALDGLIAKGKIERSKELTEKMRRRLQRHPDGVGTDPTPLPTYHLLTVTDSGTGAGTITGPGINSPSDTTESYPENQVVPLVADPDTDSTFTQWQNGASGTSPNVNVTMTAPKTVNAVFTAIPPPPPPGIGKVNGTLAVVRQDLAADVSPTVFWGNVNPGPPSRIVHHTTGGDTHQLIDGTTNPKWREYICQPNDAGGNDPGDTSRMQTGVNATAMPPGAFVAQNGESWAIYWSLRVPAAKDTQVWELFQQPKSVFMNSFALTDSGRLEVHSRTDSGSKPTTWSQAITLNRWLRFCLTIEFKRNSGRVRLHGELTGNAAAPLIPLSGLITHPTMASNGNQAALHAGIYSHQDPNRTVELEFANWQFARFDPTKF